MLPAYMFKYNCSATSFCCHSNGQMCFTGIWYVEILWIKSVIYISRSFNGHSFYLLAVRITQLSYTRDWCVKATGSLQLYMSSYVAHNNNCPTNIQHWSWESQGTQRYCALCKRDNPGHAYGVCPMLVCFNPECGDTGNANEFCRKLRCFVCK